MIISVQFTSEVTPPHISFFQIFQQNNDFTMASTTRPYNRNFKRGLLDAEVKYSQMNQLRYVGMMQLHSDFPLKAFVALPG